MTEALVIRDRVSPDSVMLNLQSLEPKYSRVGPTESLGAATPSPRPGGGRRVTVQSGSAIWSSLLDAKLIGKRTQRFYQYFSFSWPGAIWGIATSLVYAYMVYAPDPAMSHVFGRTAVAFFANVLLFVTLCGNFAVYGSKWFLEGQALARAVEQCGRTLGNDPKAGSTFNANKWDLDTPLVRCRFALKLLAHLMLVAIFVVFLVWMCPDVGKLVFVAVFLTFGYAFLYFQGYVYVVDLILVLSVHSVMHLVTMLEADPLTLGKTHSFLERGSRPTSKFRFWRDIVERHKAMSAMFESIWDPAVWVVGPHIVILCAFGVIGLAGTVEAAKKQNPAATVVWLVLSLATVVATKQLLQRMAYVTEMCSSLSLLQRSVFSLVVSRCGECPWGTDHLVAAGYTDVNEERLDHDRCLRYVALNKTGARMFGVLLDGTSVTRFSIASTVGFSALLFYVVGSFHLWTQLIPQVSPGDVVDGVSSRMH
jgi:hypothetical protein